MDEALARQILVPLACISTNSPPVHIKYVPAVLLIVRTSFWTTSYSRSEIKRDLASASH
jgi:hypothetical protein